MLSSDVVGGAERSQSAAPRLFRERVCNRSASGNRAHGFTLLEVMVVLAIIGVLAAISVPSFVRARARGQQSACITNLRQIDWAKQQWALETRASGTVVPGKSQIAPYLGRSGNIEAIVCPAGGDKTFDDCYSINSLGEVPTCKIEPKYHSLE